MVTSVWLHLKVQRQVQLVSQHEMLKINSSPSRQLQVGSKISRRNTKSETHHKIC
jgi:hypothetical protein